MKSKIAHTEPFALEEEESVFLLETDEKHSVKKIISPKSGYGHCKSCDCRGYKPNYPKDDYCKNCGHHWERHAS